MYKHRNCNYRGDNTCTETEATGNTPGSENSRGGERRGREDRGQKVAIPPPHASSSIFQHPAASAIIRLWQPKRAGAHSTADVIRSDLIRSAYYATITERNRNSLFIHPADDSSKTSQKILFCFLFCFYLTPVLYTMCSTSRIEPGNSNLQAAQQYATQACIHRNERYLN